MKKKLCLTCALSLFVTVMNAATFEWSFAVYNSQSGVAPVNVTAYLYTTHYGIWLGDGAFNADTLTLTDAMFGGTGYLPVVGYPVTAMLTQVESFSETLSKLMITWSTDSRLDRPTSSAMNQYWVIVFVDDASPDCFSFHSVEFDYFRSTYQYEVRNDFHTGFYYPTLNLGEFHSVPEPSTALLALVGISALCLRRRRVA